MLLLLLAGAAPTGGGLESSATLEGVGGSASARVRISIGSSATLSSIAGLASFQPLLGVASTQAFEGLLGSSAVTTGGAPMDAMTSGAVTAGRRREFPARAASSLTARPPSANTRRGR